ncbi:T9SS type A sorting domain-containing protein [Calditrichota bacterium LG25]
MKRFVLIVAILILSMSFSLMAQDKVWVPVFKFALDGNPVDEYFVLPHAKGSGIDAAHRYADATSMLEYHFDLSRFEQENNQHPLFLRIFLWNEYIVKISDVEITNVDEGELAAIYSDDPENNPLRDGSNATWIDIPLQDYYDLGWTDLYLAFFDGRPQDGWGPSVQYIGFYYEENPENIPDNSVSVVIQDNDLIMVDGDFADWDIETGWVNLKAGAEGVVMDGKFGDATDLEAYVAISMDNDNIYIAAEVTDDSVVIAGDSLTFYFGAYNLDTLNAYSSHVNMPDLGLSGYRNKSEPDYKISLIVANGAVDLYESKIVKGILPEAEAVCVKTENGYKIEARIPFLDLYVPGDIVQPFVPLETTFSPFAFKITDSDMGGVDTTKVVDFVPNNAAPETDYLVAGYEGSGVDNWHRWADGTSTIAYNFNVANLTSGFSENAEYRFNVRVGNEYIVEVAPTLDGERTEVLRWSEPIDSVLISFIPNNQAPETDYLVPGYEGAGVDNWHRWADAQTVVAYRFSVADLQAMAEENSELIYQTEISNEYVVRVANSTDTIEVARWSEEGTPVHDMSNKTWIEFSLQPYVDAGWDSITVLYSDGIPTDGWGASISNVKIIGRKPGIPVHDLSNMAWQSFSLNPYINQGWQEIYVFFTDGIPTDGWGASISNVNIEAIESNVAADGALITARDMDVDVSPASWGLKTDCIDKRTKETNEEIAKGILFEFIPNNQAPETDYLVPGYTGSGVDDNHRWADATDTIAYKFNLDEIEAMAPGQEIFIEFDVCNEYVISISDAVDGDKIEYFRWSEKNTPVHDGSNRTNVAISLREIRDLGFMELYVFFTDGIPTDGWGPSIYAVRGYYTGVYNYTPTPIAFRANNTPPETDYLVPGYEGSGVDNWHRWADGESVIAYRFGKEQLLQYIEEGSEPFFNVHIANEYVVSVAGTLEGERTEVLRWSKDNIPVHDASNIGWQSFSLQPFIDQGNDSIYVFFTDGIPTDGWGPSVDSVYISYREIYVYNELVRFTCDGNTVELNYLVPGYEGSGINVDHRFADGNMIMAYKFNKAQILEMSGGNDNIVIRFEVRNEYVVSVASDVNGERIEVFRWSEENIPVHDGLNQTVLALNIKPYFDMGWEDVYLIFEDGIKDTGWGPSLLWISVNSLGKLETGMEDELVNLPTGFELGQNYPNPFNPETHIRYSLPAAGHVTLTIYNVLGQKVRTLVNQVQTPGVYKVKWNGMNDSNLKVASGIYFYEIKFKDKKLLKKMILLR